LSGKEDLEEVAFRALRGSKTRGILQHSLCQHLAQAVYSAPLRKIRFVCEAAYLLSQEERRKLGINEEELDVIYRVCLSFLNAVWNRAATVTKKRGKKFVTYPCPSYTYYTIAWAFNVTLPPPEILKQYKRYIMPWIRNNYIRHAGVSGYVQLLEVLKEAIKEWDSKIDELEKSEAEEKQLQQAYEMRNACAAQFFFVCSQCTFPEDYYSLVGQFTAWALPKTQRIFAQLSSLVDPTLYTQMLGFYRRAEEAEPANGDSMGSGQP